LELGKAFGIGLGKLNQTFRSNGSFVVRFDNAVPDTNGIPASNVAQASSAAPTNNQAEDNNRGAVPFRFYEHIQVENTQAQLNNEEGLTSSTTQASIFTDDDNDGAQLTWSESYMALANRTMAEIALRAYGLNPRDWDRDE
jgi:hypothetical protein